MAGIQIGDMPAFGLERNQRFGIEPGGIRDRAARVSDGDESGAALDQPPGRVRADRAEALHGDARALELDAGFGGRNLGGNRETETRRADFIQRDAAQLARQADRTADLVPDPGHRKLVGSHVRARNEVDDVPDRRRESADDPLFLRGVH